MIEDEYRKMQKERYIIANRSIELNEKVIIKSNDIDKVVSDFSMDLQGRVKALKDAGATDSEVFSAMQKSLMAIGLTKQEAGIVSKKLVK